MTGSNFVGNKGTGLVATNPFLIDSNTIASNGVGCSISYTGGINYGNVTNNVITGSLSRACSFQSYGAQFFVGNNAISNNFVSESAVVVYQSCCIFFCAFFAHGIVVGSPCSTSDMDILLSNNISQNVAVGTPSFALQMFGQATLQFNSFNNFPSTQYELGYFDSSGNVLDVRYDYWATANLSILRTRLYDNYTNPIATQGTILYDNLVLYSAVQINIHTPWPIPSVVDSFINNSLCTLLFETTVPTGLSNFYLINPPAGSYSSYLYSCNIIYSSHIRGDVLSKWTNV